MKKICPRMIIFIFVSIGFQNIYSFAGQTSSFRIPVFSRVGSIVINEQRIRQFFASKKGRLILLATLSVILGPFYYRYHRAKKPREPIKPNCPHLGRASERAFNEAADYAIEIMIYNGINIQEFPAQDIEQQQKVESWENPRRQIMQCGTIEKIIIDELRKNDFEFAPVGNTKKYTKDDFKEIKPLLRNFYAERMSFVYPVYIMDTCYIPSTEGSGLTEYTISPEVGWTLGVIKKEDGTGYHGLNILGILCQSYRECWQ